MTFEELVVFNSTLPQGGGTLLEHLQNVRVNREQVDLVSVDISDGTVTSVVKDDIMSINITNNKIEVTFDEDELTVENANKIVGVTI